MTLLVCTLKKNRAKAVFTVNIMEAHRTYKGDSDHPYVGRTGLGEVETVGSAVLNNSCTEPKNWPCQQIPSACLYLSGSRSVLGLINLSEVWSPRNSQSRVQPAWLHFGKRHSVWGAAILLICYHVSQKRKLKHKMLSSFDSIPLSNSLPFAATTVWRK